MIIIVFYHSILFWGGSWFTKDPVRILPSLSLISEWLNSFHVHTFILISGYVFCFLKYEKGKYQQFMPFIINKSKRLLVPYAFAAAVWVIPFAVVLLDIGFKDIAAGFLLAAAPNQLWFLIVLFLLFVIFWTLSDFFHKRTFSGAILVIILYFIGAFCMRKLPNIFQLWSTLTYLPLFWLGFKLRQHGSRILYRIPVPACLMADLLLFALSRYVFSLDHMIFSLIGIALTPILNITGALTAFVALQKIAGLFNWKSSKVFSFLSKNSMQVYLFHQQIIYVFITLLNGIINPYLNAAINFAASLVLSLLISALLMKFRPTRFLIGEK